MTHQSIQLITQSNSLIKRMVIALSALTILFLMTLTGLSYIQIENKISENKQKLSKNLSNNLQNKIDNKVRLLNTSIQFIKDKPSIQKAFLDQNRTELYELSATVFNKILLPNDITHFYFIQTDQTSFLRVHEPNRYGDRIEQQTALTEAAQLNQNAYQLELGTMGTLTLRYVSPWLDEQGHRIGFIELGIDFPYLLNSLQHYINNPMVLAIDKQKITQTHWEAEANFFNEKRLPWNTSRNHLFCTTNSNNTYLKKLEQDIQAGQLDNEWMPITIFNQQQNPVGTVYVSIPCQTWKDYAFTEALLNNALIASILVSIAFAVLYYARKLYYVASYDRLTDLHNRKSFFSLLKHHIQRLQQNPNSPPFAVCLIDIDNFKKINDQHYHGFGDEVLIAFAHYLKTILPSEKLIARLGGDEFIFILEAFDNRQEIEQLLTPLKNVHCFLEDKYRSIDMTNSIGVCEIFPNNSHLTSDQIFYRTELALREAKRQGKQQIHFFEASLEASLMRKLQIEEGLIQAIQNHQLELYFQAKYGLKDQQLSSFEVLVRWPQADGSFISPAEFIPIAEKSRLIIELDDWVFKTACQQYLNWKAQGQDIQLTINLSGRYLMEMDLNKSILEHLKHLEIPPEKLSFEITEHSMISAQKRHIQKLEELRNAGIRIYLDDFGTGYSSLSYVQNFPISVLKIDQAFVRHAPSRKKDFELMKAIVSMGHSLGLSVVAEGVETAEHEKAAQEVGCDYGQGYYYHKPQAANKIDFTNIRQNHKPLNSLTT